MGARPFRYGLLILLVGFVALAGAGEDTADDGATAGIGPEVVAQYIYSVIQTDRTLYTTHVVERMEQAGKAMAREQWKKEGGLPLPAQMLKMAGEEIQGQGSDLRIRLAGLRPINTANGPADDFERVGLERVAKDPKRPYWGFIRQDGQRIFKAIYPDRAVSQACVACHNAHAMSRGGASNLNWKLYDVMGGIIIAFPVP